MSYQIVTRYRCIVQLHRTGRMRLLYHSPWFWDLPDAEQWIRDFPVGDNVMEYHFQFDTIRVITPVMGWREYLQFLYE